MDEATRHFPNEDTAHLAGTPTTRLPAVGPLPAAPGLAPRDAWLAWALLALGVILVADLFSLAGGAYAGETVGSAVVPVMGLILLYVYLTHHPHFGFLAAGAILTGLGLGIVASTISVGPGQAPLLGGAVPLGLGLGIGAIWFARRTYWWALIPAALLIVMGLQAASATYTLLPWYLEARGGFWLPVVGTIAGWWIVTHALPAQARIAALVAGALLILLGLSDILIANGLGLPQASPVFFSYGRAEPYYWPLLLVGLGVWLLFLRNRAPVPFRSSVPATQT
jgi:hypothetical protein